MSPRRTHIARLSRARLGVAPIVSLLAALTVGGTARAQSAQDGDFTIQRFQPAPGPRNFVTVEGARVDGKWAFSLGAFASYALDPFVVKSCRSSTDCSAANASQSEDVRVVEHLTTVDLMGTVTPTPRLQLALRVPVTSVGGQGIETDLSSGNAGKPLASGLSAAGVGDPMVEGKLRIVGEPRSRLVFGGSAFATAPVGHAASPGHYLGDQSLNVGVRGIGDLKLGVFTLGANLGGVWRESAGLGSTNLGPEMRYGVAGGFAVSPVVDLIAEVFGSSKLSSSAGTGSSEALLAARIHSLGGGFGLLLGAGTGLQSGVGVPKVRGFVGLLFDHHIVDTDGDTIPDDRDQCPTAPEDFDGFEDQDGCPDPDNDGDDILDVDDACPNVPGEKDPDPKKNGCPVVIADRDADGIPDDEDKCPDAGGYVIRRKGPYYGCTDTDKDGIPDIIDKCPEEPEDTDGFQDDDGCPDPDNDADGIPDDQDQCIDVPEVYNKFEDEDGCPDEVPDRDHDGIPDAVDKCPNEPETYNGIEDEDGCPERTAPALVEVGADRIKIKESVNFETDSDKITGKKSFAVLDGVAGALKGHPEIFKVEVQGHTDNAGDKAHNQTLSERRAAAVVKYLVGKGTEEQRLSSKGFGPDKPVADNKTAKGRATNRRVEFIITQSTKTLPPDQVQKAPKAAPPPPPAAAQPAQQQPRPKPTKPAQPGHVEIDFD